MVMDVVHTIPELKTSPSFTPHSSFANPRRVGVIHRGAGIADNGPMIEHLLTSGCGASLQRFRPTRIQTLPHAVAEMTVTAGKKRPYSIVSEEWKGNQLEHYPRMKLDPYLPASEEHNTCARGPAPSWRPRLNGFEPNASIVLVGVRGSGKSTLAIIASTAMNRKVVDAEKVFQEMTGLSSSAHKKAHKPEEHLQRQVEAFEIILQRHQKDSVIVCSWIQRNTVAMLKEFSATNPVIHVLREPKAIQQHLNVLNDDKIEELLTVSGRLYRSFSNFEFFNVSEHSNPCLTPSNEDGSDSHFQGETTPARAPAPYLTLKRAERHFLKFLSLLMPTGTIPFIESAFPLTSIPTEKRDYTYAVSITMSEWTYREPTIDSLETGSDAIELVVDAKYSSLDEPRPGTGHKEESYRLAHIAKAIGKYRRSTVLPIIYHIACTEAALTDPSLQSLYMDLVSYGLRVAAEYITVDLRLDSQILRSIINSKGNAKIIGHLNLASESAPPWSDHIWMSSYSKARELGCDIVRLTRPATRWQDNLDVKDFHAAVHGLGEISIPLIAFNTGAIGRHSICFNPVLSTIAPLGDEARQQPRDTVTALQATQALYSSFVYDAMDLYVFGANVGYSMSPAMHNAALQAYGIPHHYKPHSTNSMSNIRSLVNDPLFAGASVGLPFKVEAIALVDCLSRHAKAVGAINTLIPVRELNDDGTIPDDYKLFSSRNRSGPIRALYGENTDWIGIRACIRRGLSPANAVRPGASGLVIGAGGMARAAVYAMLQLGVKSIVISNRTISHAERLVAHFNRFLSQNDLPLLSPQTSEKTTFQVLHSTQDPWPARIRYPTMIVSCIPTHSIGESPAPHFTLPEKWLGSQTGGVLVELAYKSLESPLLRQMWDKADQGWVTMDGLDLLPEQGFAQFELFTGRRAPKQLMRAVVLQSYRDDQGHANLAQLKPRLDHIGDQEP
ncbi:type I 3-dehydroquinase-domain-containing protein [Zalerion maritima]|uniref:Type I 3-dehydroquinase-domain-containing protein n=1 Tax=Zalerion maritima TaxID=339359 RepID=A0AAD5WNQ2_9PEZI|nr:type I 3-dehydroquinase-domain-containing protein [Zalerion maritima]